MLARTFAIGSPRVTTAAQQIGIYGCLLWLLLAGVAPRNAELTAAELTATERSATDLSATKELSPAVLTLMDGDFVRGRLGKIEAEIVEWHSDFFTKPLRFPLGNVSGMVFPPPPQRADSDHPFLIELNNRDTFYADVKSIDETTIEIASQHLGNTKLRREFVKRISRNGPNMKVYPVPSRLEEWTTSNAEHWRNEGGSWVSNQRGATLFADVNLPQKAVIEIDLAWSRYAKHEGKPNFSVYLGTDNDETSRKQAFSFEVWDDYVVAQRQIKDDADLATLGESQVGSMHVFAYLDQVEGQLIVYDASGKLLADMHVNQDAGVRSGKMLRNVSPEIGSGLMFRNRSGTLRLQYLQVRGWSGAKPNAASVNAISVSTKSKTWGGDQLSLSDGQLQLVTKAAEGDEDEETTLPLQDVMQIDLPAASASEPAEFVAGYQDSSRISGEFVSADADSLTLKIAACEQQVVLPLTKLRGFSFNPTSDGAPDEAKNPPAAAFAPEGSRKGTLSLMDTRLHGWLVEADRAEAVDAGAENAHQESLTWKPSYALGGSPLKNNAYGMIVYRAAPKRTKVVKRDHTQVVAQQMFFIGGGQQTKKAPEKKTTPTKSSPGVHLRSGDVIPCKVVRIDERGVHIESTMTESTLIRHDLMKAAQLVKNAPMPLLSKSKEQRLLTLPRMQKNSPPQHLLFSPKGDVLRGSMTGLAEDKLEIEIRLEPHTISQDRVATIVWLHEDEIDGLSKSPEVDADTEVDLEADLENSDPDQPAKQAQDELMVQVVRNTGPRYSFVAESFSDQTIHGNSPILEAMHVKVDEVDQLLLGGFIHRAARTLPFGRWCMTPAIDPKFITADSDTPADGETTPGTESLLVGKLAPAIKLKMLDEKTDFRLADHKGHCVVLDFWATWCGPCLQVMPIVEEVVAEFEPAGVELFAVNLQERPEEIKATLERRQVNVPVVLDRDGVAAARYEANAIPQTVIIGPDGKVARVFVGSSRQFAAQLRAALKELTDESL